MVITIHPCRLCPLKNGCEQVPVFRKRAKIEGASSVTFRCGILTDALSPGRRIVIRTPVQTVGYSYPSGDEIGVYHKEVSATITSSAGSRFACTVDPDQIDEEEIFDGVRDKTMIRFRRSQPHHRIVRFLDEPMREICECNRVKTETGCDSPDGGCACAEVAEWNAELQSAAA